MNKQYLRPKTAKDGSEPSLDLKPYHSMKNIGTIILIAFFTIITSAQNLDLDRTIGAENAKKVELEMGLYQDDLKTEYLRTIGKRLVEQLENPLFEYQFHLVENPSPNAFALPGGYLYVTTGLLPILQSEDELACFLGHEIIHSNNRHSVKQLKKSIFPKLLEIPGELIGLVDSKVGEAFNKPIKTSNALILASYGRGAETEADAQGIALAAKAGYDPNAMITALTRLTKTVEVATNQKESKSYFSDHPFTPERVKAIKKRISKLQWELKAPSSSDFLAEFEGALFGQNPNKGVIDGNEFKHPELNFYIRFPEDWTIENENEYIAAINEEGNSGIYITLDDPSISPEKQAINFMNELKKEYREKLIAAEPHKIGNRDGYLLSFKDLVDGEEVNAYALWVKFQDKIFRFMGIATQDHLRKLESTVASLRPLKKKDYKTIMAYRLVLAYAKKGEVISTLSKRVDNQLNNELTAVINDKAVEEILIVGEPIKVVKAFPLDPKQ